MKPEALEALKGGISGLTLAIALILILFLIDPPSKHAMEYQEVKPYVFAELPHGRIYKTVHEGCELYIVESDPYPNGGLGAQYEYTVSAGRGCK